jgi:hypothetical protein
MKRTLAIAFSTLALTATTAAQAQSMYVPQPSFVDYVALDANQWSGSTGSSAALPASRQDRPQPSFVDYVPIVPGGSGTPGAA